MQYMCKAFIKERWWTLVLSWPDKLETVGRLKMSFILRETKPHTFLCFIEYECYDQNFNIIFHLLVLGLKTPRLLVLSIIIFMCYHFLYFLAKLGCAHTHYFTPCRLVFVLVSNSGGAGTPLFPCSRGLGSIISSTSIGLQKFVAVIMFWPFLNLFPILYDLSS